MRLSSDQLANIPASVRVAATARTRPRGYHHAWRRYRDAWGDHHAWRHSAADVSVANATAIWATVKARATTTSNRNCQTGLCMVERSEWHGLGGSRADEADSDSHTNRKKFVHSFLPRLRSTKPAADWWTKDQSAAAPHPSPSAVGHELEVGERIESEKFRLGIILRSICPTKLKGIVAIRSQVAAPQRRVVAGSAHLSKKLTVFYSRE